MMKSFLCFLKEEEEKSPLDTTVWSTENNSGSLRELLDSTEEHSSVQSVEIAKLLKKLTTSPEENKSKNIDLSYPVVVIVDENGEILVIADGHHRIREANKRGMTHINARVIPFDSLPEKFKEIFGN